MPWSATSSRIPSGSAERDRDGAPVRAVADGVVQKIDQDLLDPIRVDVGGHPRGRCHDEPVERASLLRVLHLLAHQRGQVRVRELELQLPGVELGRVEELSHEPRQAIRLSDDLLEWSAEPRVVQTFRGEHSEGELGVSPDARGRRPQLVSRDGHEILARLDAGLGRRARLLFGPQPFLDHVFIQTPGRHARDARGEDERAVYAGPEPRRRNGVGVVVHRGRIHDADHTVVEHHVRDREQERPPILIERDHDDHDEEVEMHLDVAPGEMHQDRR